MVVRSLLLVAALVAALVAPAGVANAATTHVVDFDGAASVGSCDATTPAARSITEALARVVPGDTILVCPGVVVEPGQVIVEHSVTIASFDPGTRATVRPQVDTGTSGDDRGWWLVRPGVELTLRSLNIDGNGRRIHQALRFRGRGSVTDVDIHDVGYNETGPDYSGFGVVAFGDGPVSVTRTTFSEIGRVGALFFGSDTTGSLFAENTYVGKGSGSHLDYGVEVSQGAQVTIRDNLITRARGQAQSAVSAGVLLSTAFGAGTGATIATNVLSNNANGVFVDQTEGRPLGPVSINRNAITGNSVLGVAAAGGVTVDATCNWWGSTDGSRTRGGSGDGVADGVTAIPFLISSALDGRCATDPLVTAPATEVTVDEGSTAQLSGTYEAGTPEPVVFSASSGTVTSSGTNRGAWTWTATPEDGPSGSRTVTISADNGQVGTFAFTLVVANVPPSAVFDVPATAFTDRPFTVSLRNATDVSVPDREARLSFAFDCGTGSGFGAYGPSTSTDCVVDRGGRRTVRGAVRDRDGGVREYSSVVEVFSPDGDGAPDRSAAGTVSPGGTVSTGEGAATPTDPIVTRVDTPVGGDVTIEEGPAGGPTPVDHKLLVWGARITAPAASPAEPLELTFRLDADLLPPPIPGTGVANVVPVRDGRPLLPCRGAEGADPDPCVVHRLTSGDDLVLVVRASTAGSFDFGEPTVACPDVGVPATAFTDDDGNVHRDAIACAALWGLVNGTSTTTYEPARTVTRAQLASTIARLLGLAGVSLPASPPDRFTDDDTSVHELAIEQLAAIDVLDGRTATTFAPNDPLTRAQLASVLARAYAALLGEELPPGPDAFTDDDDSVHEANIDAVAAAGLANGVGGGRFDPQAAVRRDQAASFLTRLLGVWYADFRA